MDLSIVIPVYNEEKIIGRSLKNLLNYLSPKYNNNFEIVVIDDGSSDNTISVVEKIHSKNIKLISYSPNKGKGYALRQGVAHAGGELIYLADSDLATPISELSEFIQHINNYDCVIGSRAQSGAKEKSSKLRVFAGKIGNMLINLFLNLNIKDTQCGFKMFKNPLKGIFIDCKTDGWGYDFEFLLKCEKKGYRIKEIPVKWIAGEESKVTMRSYFNTFGELIKIWWQEIGISKGFVKNIFVRTRTFQKYFVGGVITNLINIGVFFYLLYGLKFQDINIKGFTLPNYILIESIAYLVCVMFNFIYHKFFTFRSNKWNLKELIRYILLLLINYLIGVVLLYIMIDLLGIYQSYAKLISMVVVILWNFFALKLFVYRS